MDAFERVGIRLQQPPKRKDRRRAWVERGGSKCPCGAYVRVDVPNLKLTHFLECPVVDRIVVAAQASLEIPTVDDVVAQFPVSV